MRCRHCGTELQLTFIDLGSAPPSNAYLTEQTLHKPEKWYPLRVLVCTDCWLVQTEDFAGRDELFNEDYAYFSSYSTTWLDHARRYVEDMASRFSLGKNSHVVEIAANDGYLLQYVKAKNIPCTGIEPTLSTAKAAKEKGLHIVEDFFGTRLAGELVAQKQQADLIVANNVLAHVPDINDFVAGFGLLLKPEGVVTFEFPHLLNLVEQNQFDTIYHEHFSYLSLIAVSRILAAGGLDIFDVEELPTHGGSLRVYAQRSDTGKQPKNSSVETMLERELETGCKTPEYYKGFQKRVEKIKHDFLRFLLEAKKQTKVVAGYGAAAKGNTLLNYCGVRSDLLKFVVDRNPAKQGKFLPGSRISIVNEQNFKINKPDYIVVLPWNLIDEITNQLEYTKSWNTCLVSVVPQLVVYS